MCITGVLTALWVDQLIFEKKQDCIPVKAPVPYWIRYFIAGTGSGIVRPIFSRVSDPYSFFTDPDPDPEDPDGGQYGSGYGSRALMTKNW
jgi:hypothetical protein